MNQIIGFNSITRNSSLTISYVYNIIDENNNVTKTNVKESLVLLATDVDAINGNNAILNFLNERLNPVIPVILGNITIKYQADGVDLQTPTVLSNLNLATYYYTATAFTGYDLIGNSINSITLTNAIPNGVITFTYSKILTGNITLKYQDETGANIEAPTIDSNLNLGSYTYNNKVFDGYTLTNIANASQTTILTADNLNPIITFSYTKVVVAPTGTVTLNFVDQNNAVIEPPSVISGLAIGSYDYVGTVFTGYTLTTTTTQTAVITSTDLNKSLTFSYTLTTP
ncbi:MAG TPA: MucBP domain-containing protein [Clostridium sp.]